MLILTILLFFMSCAAAIEKSYKEQKFIKECLDKYPDSTPI
jgi:hypothetical protein